MINQTKQDFHISIDVDGKTALDWLEQSSGLSRQKLKQCMQQGCVWLERVNGVTDENDLLDKSEKNLVNNSVNKNHHAYVQRLRRAKKILIKDQVLHFYYDESVLSKDTKPAILIEDFGGYSIWNKPPGMLSQGSKWSDHCTIYRWAEKQLSPERSAFVVHRLDRAANGLIIVAHKKSVASQFARMFELRQIDKHYLVEVIGDFSSMVANTDDVLTINDAIDNKTAKSYVRVLACNEVKNTTTLEIQIETGRKHQIRKHLSNLGFPVLGDRLYGGFNEELYELVDLQLQAKSLKFICPLTREDRVFTLDS
ncbi:MAG: tRNA pseudouridine32 synthase/23S rRNA pseudouridine746 synthase [Cocleimonas sp.]|jgi:tRNA pseudouridine32 synthase/23S rRNA pseudouridine746 synthase